MRIYKTADECNVSNAVLVTDNRHHGNKEDQRWTTFTGY